MHMQEAAPEKAAFAVIVRSILNYLLTVPR